MPTKAINNTMPTETQELQESEEAEQQERQEISSTTIDHDENDNDDTLSKYLFCFGSFHAVFAPVSICMIVSALAVVYLNTDETRQAGAEAFSQTYEVFDLEDSNTKQNVLASLGNTLIIVCVVCGMTFIVVLLYKFKSGKASCCPSVRKSRSGRQSSPKPGVGSKNRALGFILNIPIPTKT